MIPSAHRRRLNDLPREVRAELLDPCCSAQRLSWWWSWPSHSSFRPDSWAAGVAVGNTEPSRNHSADSGSLAGQGTGTQYAGAVGASVRAETYASPAPPWLQPKSTRHPQCQGQPADDCPCIECLLIQSSTQPQQERIAKDSGAQCTPSVSERVTTRHLGAASTDALSSSFGRGLNGAPIHCRERRTVSRVSW